MEGGHGEGEEGWRMDRKWKEEGVDRWRGMSGGGQGRKVEWRKGGQDPGGYGRRWTEEWNGEGGVDRRKEGVDSGRKDRWRKEEGRKGGGQEDGRTGGGYEGRRKDRKGEGVDRWRVEEDSGRV
ncbi:dehydrin Rab18-like [Haliotis rubra]|uniref:dehydrin Rab18-like n=1 Tax=Haliotis rubra TaxID=36100 RepID=UPI001EE5EB32|nr:dehydrin Rab18-like [Haliotis rubra]